MKRILCLLVIFILSVCTPVYGDDISSDIDIWNYFGNQDIYGQKAVSDEEFEDTVQQLENKKNKKKKLKGDSFHQGNETEFITKMPDELPILSIPVEIILSDGSKLPIGHYQIEGAKKGDSPYLKLYQAHYLFAELPAVETNDDFGEREINFVKLDSLDDHTVIIKFGSVDFNAYSVLNIAQ